MTPIYAQPGTTMVEGRGDDLLNLSYRVVWMDPQGHVHATPWLFNYGGAYILADKLDHGEPYVH